MTSEKLIELSHAKLSKKRWAWFATLTFHRGDIVFWRANRAFELWIIGLGADGD